MSHAMLTRRQAMKTGLASAAAMAVAPRLRADDADQPILKIGLLTDVHHADKDTRGSRHYRDALPKLKLAMKTFADEKVDAIIQLGDLIDAHPTVEGEEAALREVSALFKAAHAPYYFVLGNHCLDSLSKARYAELGGCRGTHYHVDMELMRCIFLDANYRADGVAYDAGNFKWTDCFIPPDQLAWLGDTLRGTDKSCVIFTHQRLDPDPHHTVANHEAVREVIAQAGGQRVKAVLQGHSHRNHRVDIDGIPYIVLRGMIEGAGLTNNAYSVLKIHANGTFKLQGFDRQASYTF